MKKTLFFLCAMMVAGAHANAQGCSTCGGFAAGGYPGGSVGPNFSVSLGNAEYGQSAGSLTFDSSVPDPNLFTPIALQFSAPDRPDVIVLTTNIVTASATSTVETEAVLSTNLFFLTNSLAISVAGNGSSSYSGDGGAATNASFHGPTGVAVDALGNLYIATENAAIRKVDTNGIITTIAGNGSSGYSGDGGSATNAELGYPAGVAVDVLGNLYIADENSTIRKVDTNGIITTVAGNGNAGYNGDGGAATNAELAYPTGVAVDALGNIYIADKNNSRIRKVDTNGIITTVAGNGSSGYSGDGGAATNANLASPSGVAVDTLGNLYIADEDDLVIRKVDTSGTITTVAGNGTFDDYTDGIAATNVGLFTCVGVTVDTAGNFYITDGGSILKVDTNGIITTVVGGIGGDAYSGAAVNSSGNLYLAGNNMVFQLGTAFSILTNCIYELTDITVTNVDTTLTTNVVIRQVLAPQALADIPTPPTTNGYVINFYYPTNIVGTNLDGTYQVSGSPFITWLVTNSNPSATFELQISEFGINPSYGLMKQWTYDYSTSSGGWAVQTLGGIQQTMITTNLDDSTYQVINTIRGPSGPVVQQVVNTYKIFNWSACTNVSLVTNTVGVGASAKITTYTYWDPATFGSTSLELKKTVVHPDGSWEYYSSYDSLGRPTTVYSSFEDAAVGDTSNGRETDYTYDPSAAGVSDTGDDGTLNIYTPRLTVQKIQGHEISRSYAIYPSAATNFQVQCIVAGAAWNASGNLITTNLFYTSGPNQFYIQAAQHPDGTLSTYNYITNGTYQTNIVVTGKPDLTDSYVVDGVSNVTVLNTFGYNVSAASYDVLSGLMLSDDIYANFDSYDRPQQVTHLDGTTEYTQYACCGLDNTVDRDGVTTAYLYDSDKRQYGYEKIYSGGTSNVITYENTLDAIGRAVQSYRIGTDSSVVTMSQSAYDTAGRLIFQTNALNGVTTYVETTNSLGALVRTTTYPNGGTRIESYYLDGSLKSVTGTAAHGQAYAYGYGTDVNGNTCTYTVVTNLDNSGNLTTEWTKTFFDMAGRTTEILYPDCRYSQSFYNAQGQLAKQIDPDGVVTLYQYNAKGDLAYSAVDLNQNGSIDFSGTDRITQTTNDVTTDHSTTVRRARNYVWLDGSSTGTLVSSTEASADGLNSWQTQYRDTSTAVTTHSQTVPGASRTVTTTMPDGSYTVGTYSYSRLVSSVRYDSTSAQVGGTTYGYDTQGRQNTMTDARNGTTTLAFNNADLVTTNTTPNPGGGLPETTVTTYNNMLQATGVTQPDGTVVNSVYLLTGELGLQYGSRTYPVGYSYDYAGRMQTMTNWSGYGTLAGARVTTWRYDGCRGFLTNKVYDDGHGPSYAYTAAGRLASRAWVRGVTTTYKYDTAGGLTNIIYSDSTPGVTNVYDRLGRLSGVSWTNITDTLSYNLANELTSESFSGGILNGLSVTNGYDSDLRRTALSALSGGSPLLSAAYAYDNASRLSTVTDGNNNSAAYSYLANSPLVSQIVFKQSGTTRMTTSKSYDYLNRLTQISSAPSASGTLPLTFNYNYNPANQRTKDTLADGSYWIYGYDSLGQVTNACKFFADGTPVAGQQFDYSFDTIGNRTQTKAGGDQTGANLRVANYTNNSLNQITSRDVPAYVDIMGASIFTNAVSVNGSTAYRKGEYFRQQLAANNSASPLWTNIIVSGGLSVTGNVYVAKQPEVFQYDGDGNLTNDGRFAYIWDGENRLTKMTLNTNVGPQYTLNFAYDSKGRRIQKLVATNGAAIYTNRFLYDGWNLVAELNPSSSLVRSYMWGSDLSGSMQGAGGVGGLLEVSYYGSSTTNCFPAYDGNGNISALINANDGTIAANYDYGAFGEPIRITGVMARNNPFRFSTKYNDDESDLLYYGYRYYKPSTGTWPNRDPLEEQGGANLYAFVGNAPLTYYDWLGLCSKLNCHTFSEQLQIKEYKIVGVTATLAASGEICSCCGCNGKAVDVGVSFSWQVGFGWADEFTIAGIKVGYDILGPQVGDATELHYVKECGEDKGAVHIDKSTGAFLSGEIGGGIGIVGLSGSYGGHYYAEYGIEADSTGADAYITFGYDVTANGDLSIGAFNYTFTHYFSDNGSTHKTPRLSW